MAKLTFNTAMKLLAQKNYQAVYELALSALRETDKDPLAFFFIGVIASDTGQHEKALELFSKAAQHGPKTVRYQAFYAKALMTLGQSTLAKTQADRAAALGTDDAFLADMIGTVYSRAGSHALALPLFKKAVRLNPRWAIFQFNLAVCAQFVGDISAAKSAYKQAVKLNPKFYQAWFSLVSLDKQTAENNHLATLKRLFNEAEDTAEVHLLLGHSIAKTLEDMEQFPESLEWLHRAKALQKSQSPFDLNVAQTIFSTAKSIPQVSHPDQNNANKTTPIFILGLPRTGTTLVDRILSSHAAVTSAGELDLFAQILARYANISPAEIEKNLLKAQKSDLRKIGDIYIEEIDALSGGASYLIDKTPMNFFYAGLIQVALPNARIIALRRGAMDSCLSNYRQMFALQDRRFDYAFDLEHTAAYYREFDSLMEHWRSFLPPSQFMEVRYEDIISQQEKETRRILDFCGLDWDEACMRFHENAAPVDTASSMQVRKPLYSGAIGRWQKYGDTLAPLKTALGNLANQ